MQVTLDRLTELLQEDCYDADFLLPTNKAVAYTRYLLREVASYCPKGLPNATPATIGDGGIVVQWGPQSRYVRLNVFPGVANSFIYRKAGTDRQVLPATPERLSEAFGWWSSADAR